MDSHHLKSAHLQIRKLETNCGDFTFSTLFKMERRQVNFQMKETLLPVSDLICQIERDQIERLAHLVSKFI